MNGSRLPRPIVFLIRRVVPARRAAAVIADLEDEYTIVRAARAAGPARLWLAREAASLIGAYAAAPISRLKASGPMWLRDAHLVLRGIRQHPIAAFGAAAMLSSGLVAMLVTAGLTSTLLFRPVSALHGDALRRLTIVDRQGRTTLRLSYLELEMVREHLADAAIVAAVNLQPVVVRVHGADFQTMAEVVDGRYFQVTGTRATLGRVLLAADDRADAPRVAVIAEPLWRDRFGASPDALGDSILLNGAAYSIVGVAQALGSSSFLGASVDVWVPLAHADPLLNRDWRTNVANRWFTSYALPAQSLAEINGRLAAATADLARLYPDPWRDRRLQTAAGTVLTGNQRATVIMLAAILGGFAVLILAVSSANVSGLLLTRAAADRRHAAIHLSLGSGRAAVARRLLLEGCVLGLAGGCLALAMYVWARTWFAEIVVLPTLALRLNLPLDIRIIALVVIAGIAAGVLLAVGPAIWATRLDVSLALRDASPRASGGRALARARRVLVSAQVCLSLVLIVGAVLFTRSLDALSAVELGFPRRGLVAMDFDIEPAAPAMKELPALAREALARVGAIAGITGVAMSNRAPVDQSTPTIEARPPSLAGTAPSFGVAGSAPDTPVVGDVSVYLATAGYFETVGLPLVAGRPFTVSETDSKAGVVIVNETLAERLWPRGDAIDRALSVAGESQTLRVVGVAKNSKYRALSETARPHLYRPTPPELGLALLARTSGDPYDALRAIQRTLDGVGPGLVGFFPRTLDDHVAIELLPTRAAAAAATGLGTLALVLSAVGLYGLVAWFVELRRREIGVRMALGATAADVRSLVFRQAIDTTLPGMVAGIALAAVFGVTARSALFGVRPVDPYAVGAGVAALLVLVIVASYLPSRRAMRVDPATALRQ